jgi:hypothetical protein
MTRLIMLAFCLTLSACLPPPPSAYLTKAADSSAKIRPAFVADATEGTRDFVPAEPGDWEKINRAVVPKESQK